jgi:hypothetical protein
MEESMSTFQWKDAKGQQQGIVWADKTAGGVVLRIQPHDDFYSGELDQWSASELMLHFYSLIKRDPGDKPAGALLMMVREICKLRVNGGVSERHLAVVEICALLGVPFVPVMIKSEPPGADQTPEEKTQ